MKLDAKAWFAIILILFFIISGLFAVFSPPSFVQQQATPTPTSNQTGPSFEGRALFNGQVVAFTPDIVARCPTNNSLQVQNALRAVSGVEGAIALGGGTFRIVLSANATRNPALYASVSSGLHSTLAEQCANATIARTALITINETVINLENPQNTTQKVPILRRQLANTPLTQCFERICGLTALTAESTAVNDTLQFVMVAQIQDGQVSTLPVIGQAIAPPTITSKPTSTATPRPTQTGNESSSSTNASNTSTNSS